MGRHLAYAKEHLQLKMAKMEERMRALEDALAIAQTQHSDHPHELLATPFKLDDDEETTESQEAPSPAPRVEDVISAFGTLHIDQREKTVSYFGTSGGAESLLLDKQSSRREPKLPNLQESLSPVDLRALDIPEELDVFFQSFPFTPVSVHPAPVRRTIESLLPPFSRAEQLCHIYMENLSWVFSIVTLKYLVQELLPAVYVNHLTSGRSRSESYSAHDLALLFIVLAVGALVDLDLEPYNDEAQRYYVLSRAATSLEPILEGNSIATVKLLHLMSIYNGMCGRESALSNTYALLNVASTLAQRIGLHIDPSRWGLDRKTCYERRTCFWNLVCGDLWQSLGTGRPPSMANTIGDCQIPTEQEEQEFQRGELSLGFGIWGFHHSKECIWPLAKCVVGAKPPSYQQVLDLDKQIRSSVLPKEPLVGDASPSIAMRSWVRSHYLELMLLYLHRPFFAKAISSHPDNPLESPYAYSFINSYHCAVVMLQTTAFEFAYHPRLMSRVWQVWTFTFVSSVIIGAVATRPQQYNFDPPPIEVFEESLRLFTNAAKINTRAAKALPVLMTMRDKILRMQTRQSRVQPNLSYSPTQTKSEPDDEDIAIFGGRTQLLSSSAASPTVSLPTLPPSIPPLPLPPTSIIIDPRPSSATFQQQQQRSIRIQDDNLQTGGTWQQYSDYVNQQATSSSTSADNNAYSNVNAEVGYSESYRFPSEYHYEQRQPDEEPHVRNDFIAGSGPNNQQWVEPSYADLFQQQYPQMGPTMEPVDFTLEESWTSFMRTYAGMPPQPPSH
ncbi:hypothetical protein C8Q75DRAFT_454538 [Abortiporus biennis]|nr:hypothetical protein C8Q75DRAFT_454538 [Abortiporus biennis]